VVRYMGGKHRIKGAILKAITEDAGAGKTWVEPFLGGGSVAAEASKHHEKLLLADLNPLVVALWQPSDEYLPAEMTESRYQELREGGLITREAALAAFGCSFGGKQWGGWARGGTARDYWAEAVHSWSRKYDAIHSVDTTVVCSAYGALSIPPGAVVYCDPPYAGTTGYRTGAWDAQAFYSWAEDKAANSSVYVSEYSAPASWRVVWERDTSAPLNNNSNRAVERLFTPE